MRPLIGRTHFRTTQQGNPAPYRKITHGCCRWAVYAKMRLTSSVSDPAIEQLLEQIREIAAFIFI
jgi:hypothetical protein